MREADFVLPYGGITRIRFKGFFSLLELQNPDSNRPLAMGSKLRESSHKSKRL